MFRLKYNPNVSSYQTTFVIVENDNISIDFSIGFNLIHDDFGIANMGYYISTYVMNKCTGDGCTDSYYLGGYLTHVKSDGTISWEANPNISNFQIRLQYLDLLKTSTSEWYLFGCGYNHFTRL